MAQQPMRIPLYHEIRKRPGRGSWDGVKPYARMRSHQVPSD